MMLVISTVLVLILPTMALVIAESVPAYSSDSPIGGAGVLVFSCCPSVCVSARPHAFSNHLVIDLISS